MSNSIYTVDKYVATKPGEPFRLLPIGKLVKGGKVREVTPDLISRFRLPHFLPPIKLGSHNQETRAGGHIVELQVREDGLWAIPQLTTEGVEALERGDYKYHSPEIIWSGSIEDPKTGAKINGPIIMGDALLHTPHLGEDTALYSLEISEEKQMDKNDEMVPVSVVDRVAQAVAQALNLKAETEPVVNNEPPEEVETFEAEYLVEKDRAEQLEAELNDLKAQETRKNRVSVFATEIGEGVDAEVYEQLADMEDESAAVFVKTLKALLAQAEEGELDKEIGNSGEKTIGSSEEAFHAEIAKIEQEKGVGYVEAFEIVKTEQPELFSNWYGGA